MITIGKNALEFMLGVSRDLHPREFMGMLRMENNVITEVLVFPKSIWGEGFSSVASFSIPHDNTIVGSVHSHPSKNFRPSKVDLVEFGRSGKLHIIIKAPYLGAEDIACYDSQGNRIPFEVIE